MISPLAASSRGLEGSTWDSSAPGGEHNGGSNSTMSTGLSLPIDSLTRNGTRTLGPGDHIPCPQWPASLSEAPAKTSLSWATLATTDRNAVLMEIEASYSSPLSQLSSTRSRAGLSSKTSRRCSIATVAETLSGSSRNLPNAGIWDATECSMLNISESPKVGAAFSWSRVLDGAPIWSSWMTPRQWRHYLCRLARNGSQSRRMLGLAILFARRTRSTDAIPESIWAVNFSLLRGGGLDQMVGRYRETGVYGFPQGLDASNIEEAYGAGNAVCPAIAEWIARILLKS
jgi:hypothetical protein